MKKAERDIYWTLASDVTAFGLCAFCEYSVSGGCGNDAVCLHPLPVVREREIEQLDDCWGFKPSYTVPEMADIVGEILTHDWAVITTERKIGDKLLPCGTHDYIEIKGSEYL